MSDSLVFLPDISGFTKFVQSTEVSHSQHIIAELLELLIASNHMDLELAEVEGDALFFYREAPLPTKGELEAQIEKMMIVFYSHLQLLQKNRICPCRGCISAPELDLKIIAHCGPLQFITVQNKRKPYGPEVIQAHRLMKNSVSSDRYILLSQTVATQLGFPENDVETRRPLMRGQDTYDDVDVDYLYHVIEKESVNLIPHPHAAKVELTTKPTFTLSRQLPVHGTSLLEYITDYGQRPYWTKDLNELEYNEDEVTRVGTEHTCVINDKRLNFKTVTKDGAQDQLVYGELNTTIPRIDRLYIFYLITPRDESTCDLEVEVYLQADSFLGKLMVLIAGSMFKKSMSQALDYLEQYIQKKSAGEPVERL